MGNSDVHVDLLSVDLGFSALEHGVDGLDERLWYPRESQLLHQVSAGDFIEGLLEVDEKDEGFDPVPIDHPG